MPAQNYASFQEEHAADKLKSERFRKSIDVCFAETKITEKMEAKAAVLSAECATLINTYQEPLKKIAALALQCKESAEMRNDFPEALIERCNNGLSLFAMFCDAHQIPAKALDGKTTYGRLRSKASNYHDYKCHTYPVYANIDLLARDCMSDIPLFLSEYRDAYTVKHPSPFHLMMKERLQWEFNDYDAFHAQLTQDMIRIMKQAESMTELADQTVRYHGRG